jgi:hypothetical protein
MKSEIMTALNVKLITMYRYRLLESIWYKILM